MSIHLSAVVIVAPRRSQEAGAEPAIRRRVRQGCGPLEGTAILRAVETLDLAATKKALQAKPGLLSVTDRQERNLLQLACSQSPAMRAVSPARRFDWSTSFWSTDSRKRDKRFFAALQ